MSSSTYSTDNPSPYFLQVALSLEGRAGGIARSVTDLSVELSRIGYACGIWTQTPVSSSLKPFFDDRFIYTVSGRLGPNALSKEPLTIIHTHGIWSLHLYRAGKYARKKGIPRVVSTRGMVESWALNQKRWKKWFAWNLYQRSDLKKSALIHATSKEEQESIERLRLGVKTVFIPNGVCLPDFEEISPKGVVNPNEIKQALFLSRIHPKKGLPLLVEAWKEVRPEGWEMLVVGPDDGGHLGEVKKMVQNAGLSSNWRFLDSVEGIEKWRLLYQVDIFILPTYSENFGNVVAEALIAGVPVLTTTGAPWRELAKHGFGWCVAPNVKEIAIALREATSLTRNSLKQKGQAGRVWAKERFSIEATARSMLDAYQSVNEQKRIAKSK